MEGKGGSEIAEKMQRNGIERDQYMPGIV